MTSALKEKTPSSPSYGTPSEVFAVIEAGQWLYTKDLIPTVINYLFPMRPGFYFISKDKTRSFREHSKKGYITFISPEFSINKKSGSIYTDRLMGYRIDRNRSLEYVHHFDWKQNQDVFMTASVMQRGDDLYYPAVYGPGLPASGVHYGLWGLVDNTSTLVVDDIDPLPDDLIIDLDVVETFPIRPVDDANIGDGTDIDILQLSSGERMQPEVQNRIGSMLFLWNGEDDLLAFWINEHDPHYSIRPISMITEPDLPVQLTPFEDEDIINQVDIPSSQDEYKKKEGPSIKKRRME